MTTWRSGNLYIKCIGKTVEFYDTKYSPSRPAFVVGTSTLSEVNLGVDNTLVKGKIKLGKGEIRVRVTSTGVEIGFNGAGGFYYHPTTREVLGEMLKFLRGLR